MKKSKKILLILLITGALGLAAMGGVVIGTGALYSRETTKSYTFDEIPAEIQLETVRAQVSLVPSDECRVEAYVKAWRPSEINMDDVLSVQMEDGILTVTEISFPNDFFGFFPQPYEMKLTIYAPQPVLDTLGGNLK